MSASGGAKAGLRAFVALAVFLAGASALFYADPQNRYLWVKALHVISVMSWMAGLLYLPRLFIYHHEHEVGSPASETFKVMEKRLMMFIMMPAMILSWIFGLWMAIEVFQFHGGWLHMKLTAVVVLTGVHAYFYRSVKEFGRDRRVGTPRFWRLMNEGPTVLMIVIVLLVILKPFA